MDYNHNQELAHDFPPFLRIYKDGRAERYHAFGDVHFVPPGRDPDTGIHTKDIHIPNLPGVTARIFLPKLSEGPDHQKLPLVVHYHGGGFCDGSPHDSATLNYLIGLVLGARVVAISIGYRLAPENPLPTAYEDSLEALKWLASGTEPDPWVSQYADLGRVFLAGDSAGANIAHFVAVQAGISRLTVETGFKINGLLILHPFFGSEEISQNQLYSYLYPASPGYENDPKLNPSVDPDLHRIPVGRILICVGERDWIKDRGLAYYETLCKSEWSGTVELEENKEEDHCFHLFKRNENTKLLMKKLAEFVNLP
ncbi:2-hydroxyisoflavanone dehydratase-like [Punica granatum]|uniref:Alpha/beta hydrolase fold-3 domain-containing protein n=2 Tax=Punica granatum TaxID=22663 RepID=A0A218XFP4_PUNGR|nr:2-hydroxyisoflavanone dehydratase-like [Punica granatum]OWM83743.1 hypothetical protein CDL15_Pgr004173 [Punica granatum]PKI55572.1 hypothetical protein CRG98_024072 [Punica granatum]